jgi:hypothetical protein
MPTLLEQTTVATTAGAYAVQWFWDEDAERPCDEGFVLLSGDGPRQIAICEASTIETRPTGRPGTLWPPTAATATGPPAIPPAPRWSAT